MLAASCVRPSGSSTEGPASLRRSRRPSGRPVVRSSGSPPSSSDPGARRDRRSSCRGACSRAGSTTQSQVFGGRRTDGESRQSSHRCCAHTRAARAAMPRAFSTCPTCRRPTSARRCRSPSSDGGRVRSSTTSSGDSQRASSPWRRSTTRRRGHLRCGAASRVTTSAAPPPKHTSPTSSRWPSCAALGRCQGDEPRQHPAHHRSRAERVGAARHRSRGLPPFDRSRLPCACGATRPPPRHRTADLHHPHQPPRPLSAHRSRPHVSSWVSGVSIRPRMPAAS
jgi:hypothetical protein